MSVTGKEPVPKPRRGAHKGVLRGSAHPFTPPPLLPCCLQFDCATADALAPWVYPPPQPISQPQVQILLPDQYFGASWTWSGSAVAVFLPYGSRPPFSLAPCGSASQVRRFVLTPFSSRVFSTIRSKHSRELYMSRCSSAVNTSRCRND